MSNTVEISLEAVLSTDNMERAWAAVKANAGAGGVDGKGIAETEEHLKHHWPGIREKRLAGGTNRRRCGRWTGPSPAAGRAAWVFPRCRIG